MLRSITFPKPVPPVVSTANEGSSGEADDAAVAQAIGCVIVGTTATTLALAAGSENVVNIISGGLVTPTNQVALYTAMVGVVFGTFCAVGQALTPLYMHIMTKRQSSTMTAQGNGACLAQRTSEASFGRSEDFSVFHASLRMDSVEPVAVPEEDYATPSSFLRKRR